MGALAAPLLPDKLDAWQAWMAELNGPRKAEFEAFNARHKLTAHRAWLQGTPDGGHLVIAVHDGPGGDDFMGGVASSDDSFDQWFVSKVAECHGIDMSGPLPPPAERKL
ncbi:MAG: hypothetical protein ABJA93_03295 [Sporichthyaceae bacterium]